MQARFNRIFARDVSRLYRSMPNRSGTFVSQRKTHAAIQTYLRDIGKEIITDELREMIKELKKALYKAPEAKAA